MKLAVIVAVSANGVIGRDNDLPWRLPADLARFKRLTMGHHLVMGRKTFESIGRPLPGRTTVVLSRSRPDLPDGVLLATSLDDALTLCNGDDLVFVAGGAAVFAESLPRAKRIYLTRLHADFEGDVFFPPFDPSAWDLVEQEEHAADDRHPCDFSFLTYERVAGASAP
jgi:dihydrofolate reductase